MAQLPPVAAFLRRVGLLLVAITEPPEGAVESLEASEREPPRSSVVEDLEDDESGSRAVPIATGAEQCGSPYDRSHVS